MENSLLIGLSRQMTLQRELAVVANNVANINTTGFKAGGSLFQEFLMPGARDTQFAGQNQRLSFVQDRDTWHDFTGGPLRQTGNPLDVAIDGEGFLAVQGPDGERYTRAGGLQINASGQIVTAAGYPVLGDGGPIQLQPNDRGISISPDGTLTVQEGDGNTDSPRGKLRLVTFAQMEQLQSDGSNLFKAEGQPVPAVNARIVQGSIEQSNVSGVIEMSRLIEITRNYTQMASLLQQHSELRRSSIERLAEVPA